MGNNRTTYNKIRTLVTIQFLPSQKSRHLSISQDQQATQSTHLPRQTNHHNQSQSKCSSQPPSSPPPSRPSPPAPPSHQPTPSTQPSPSAASTNPTSTATRPPQPPSANPSREPSTSQTSSSAAHPAATGTSTSPSRSTPETSQPPNTPASQLPSTSKAVWTRTRTTSSTPLQARTNMSERTLERRVEFCSWSMWLMFRISGTLTAVLPTTTLPLFRCTLLQATRPICRSQISVLRSSRLLVLLR
ncbi:hypothetical protein CB0940_07219 [Cercospora beticola]|uniref:Uncharacterized protein n=1 Tax=Cercospora beticola TaxID=122368 RepID=A0A2G5H7N1_CERBT|nr:hypothetical protein CB0940_07219 [Cercospora beticola]PIA88528.1 hypothetical protein CB0940_07219 [Cercospora beticola]